MQAEIHEQIFRDWHNAAKAREAQVNCRDAILGPKFFHRENVFLGEELGDALSHFDLVKALSVFQQNIQILMHTEGEDNSLVESSSRKLQDIQKKLLATGRAAELNVNATSACSYCAAPAKSKCSRCILVVYCCRGHQKVHWKIHQKICRSTEKESAT